MRSGPWASDTMRRQHLGKHIPKCQLSRTRRAVCSERPHYHRDRVGKSCHMNALLPLHRTILDARLPDLLPPSTWQAEVAHWLSMGVPPDRVCRKLSKRNAVSVPATRQKLLLHRQPKASRPTYPVAAREQASTSLLSPRLGRNAGGRRALNAGQSRYRHRRRGLSSPKAHPRLLGRCFAAYRDLATLGHMLRLNKTRAARPRSIGLAQQTFGDRRRSRVLY